MISQVVNDATQKTSNCQICSWQVRKAKFKESDSDNYSCYIDTDIPLSLHSRLYKRRKVGGLCVEQHVGSICPACLPGPTCLGRAS